MNTPRCFRILLNLQLLPAITSLSYGQFEGAIVTKHGAQVHGVIEGSLVALEETADVSVDRTARISGDLMLPREKAAPVTTAPGLSNVTAQNSKISARAKIAVADSTSVKGKQKVVSGFAVPRTAAPAQPKGKDAIILKTEKDKDPNFKNLKDLTVKQSKRVVILPAGNYGEIAVDSGRLQLGRKGSLTRDRYYFQSLAVGADGSVELLGPVVVTVGHLGSIQGKLGSDRFTNYLDLRVASGAVTLGADTEIHGVVTATESAVTLGQRVKVRGGIICDQAVVESTARFTGVQPSWGKESSGSSLPLFIHKAARIEAQMPELNERYAGRYAASVSYPNDEPVIVLEGNAGGVGPLTRSDEQHAFFDACRTLFDGTGFARGSVRLILPAPAGSRFGPDIVNITMDRGQFEDHLWAIGRQKQPRDNIVRIRDDPALLGLFLERSLKVAINTVHHL